MADGSMPISREIRAHGKDHFARRFIPHTWEQRDKGRQPVSHSLHTCSYCGSIRTDELLAALKAGAKIHDADWKYGWPHKFYIDGVPNERAGETVEVGSEGGFGMQRRPIMGQAPVHAYLKFYSEHLLDCEPAEFAELAQLIAAQTRIMFEVKEGELYYRAASA